MMATGSPDGLWRPTLNAASSHYRTLTAHLANGLPSSVGDDANVVRVRWGGKPHRKANGAWKEFSATVRPEQPNKHAGGIRLFGAIWLTKQQDPGVSIPAASRYMYLKRGQEWRVYSAQAHVRGQRHRPAPGVAKEPPTSALSSPPTNGTNSVISTPVTPGFRRVYNWAACLSISAWEVTVYGLPTGAGIATGMVRNHRDVLFAPVLCSPHFGIWTWCSGSPDSCAIFAAQVHDNATALRPTISYGLIELVRRLWCMEMVMMFGVLGLRYWETYK